MDSHAIRQAFIDFFVRKGHTHVPAAPLVNKNDPTLLFVNAGMNPFKDYFLGNKPPEHPRLVDSQHCLRVSGKHNDLEEVGLDTYHHTLFEMLGNWSLGDYFKKEAIAWAWELLTTVYNIPQDRIYVTVFGGDKKEGLAADEEARALWQQYVEADHLLDGSKKDNFWEMGATGPCGPCSELHVDIRPDTERNQVDGRALVNQDHPQVVEIWNLVFMQFNRLADGSLEQLPAQHVDTGMGFERLAMVLQGKQATYDTDIFAPLLQAITQKTGIAYGAGERTDVAMRVMVDHVRAVACAIAEGQLPSNQQAGYVIRRILRRAVRYAHSVLQIEAPFLHTLVPLVAQQLGPVVPGLLAQEQLVSTVIQAEEKAFLHTLAQGLQRLEQVMQTSLDAVLPGEVVFELYDTYGFPHDLTALIAQEQGRSIDEQGFQRCLKAQKERSKKATALVQDDWQLVHPDEPTTFVGYDVTTAEARLIRYRQVKAKGKTLYQLVLDQTPFYPEGGGQVGDTGHVQSGEERIMVEDTQKENDLIVHFVKKLPTDLKAPLHCHVAPAKRLATANNHTATHLLHAALREVLGQHVTQKGSLVNDQLLRFDFAHPAKVTAEQLADITTKVNASIRANWPLQEERAVPLAVAKERGAMALFGEKYGETVRMIRFGDNYSVELCGGIHAAATGQLGTFVITQETAVAAGVRRIEALTGQEAADFVARQSQQLQQLQALLQHPKDPTKALEQVLSAQASLKKEVAQYEQQHIATVGKQLQKALTKAAPYTLVQEVTVPHVEALKQLAFDLKKAHPEQLFVVLGANLQGGAHLAVMITEDLHDTLGHTAQTVVKALAPHIKGGGGGQPFFATAGGKHAVGLAVALEEAHKLVPLHLSRPQ